LESTGSCRLLLGNADELATSIFAAKSDIAFRGKLQGRWLAKLGADWIKARTEVRYSSARPPQALISVAGFNLMQRGGHFGKIAVTLDW
jgi:hypothetical protein